MMAVYLLHSSVWIGGAGKNGARHYAGYVDDVPGALQKRLRLHRKGQSDVGIVRAFVEAGGKLYLGNFFPFLSRDDERRIKDHGHLHSLCQVCSAMAEAGEAISDDAKERPWTARNRHWSKQRIEQSIRRANEGDTTW